MDASGRGNWKGRSHNNMTFKYIDESNRFNYERSHYNMTFYCQWPIKSFTEISVSLAFASGFFVNNSSSRCPRTISLDDRDKWGTGYKWTINKNVLCKQIYIFILLGNYVFLTLRKVEKGYKWINYYIIQL